MHWLRANGRQASSWKNGGGSTHELVTFPPGASLDDFTWRLSIAHVDADGPFSRFEGIDRILAVISPGILELSSGDGVGVALTRESPPYAFAGETAVHGAVPDGLVADLNLMTRRDRAVGSLRRRNLRRQTRLGEHAAHTVVVSLQAVDLDEGQLGPMDAVWLEPGETAWFTPSDKAAEILIASISPRPGRTLP